MVFSPLRVLRAEQIRIGGYTYDIEGKVVGVAAGEEEVLAIEGKLVAVGCDKTSRGRTNGACEANAQGNERSILHNGYYKGAKLKITSIRILSTL